MRLYAFLMILALLVMSAGVLLLVPGFGIVAAGFGLLLALALGIWMFLPDSESTDEPRQDPAQARRSPTAGP